MAVKGKVVFNNTDATEHNYGGLLDVNEGKEYAATLYGPEEIDDQGADGCGYDYIVYYDDEGMRCGYGVVPDSPDATIAVFTADE